MKSNNVGRHLYQYFQGLCPDFQQINTFADAVATYAPPAPTPLLFITASWVITVSWVISSFINIDLKQICCSCCNRKARAASVQSFTLWQQVTMDITRRDHCIIACSHHVYMGVVLRTHPVRGESHIQRQRRGCNAAIPAHRKSRMIFYNFCYNF